ncbi:2OG-Fe(II) oxygenase [Sphingomonas sp. MJ1 (PH-R8)]|uniref:2OG-Fe(II) oxygenase n=1 Tax=Sphingomonas sp. MJ1 (PH-R8) TaxID=3112950 RepID=UPI003A889297
MMTKGEPHPAHVDMLLEKGRTVEAIAATERAAASGDKEALFRLALWHLIGEILPRDLPRAHQLLRKAREAGHVEAAHMEIALTVTGSGAQADWSTGCMLLQKLSSIDAAAAHQAQLLTAMRLDAFGVPKALPKAEVLSASPRVTLFRDFLTEAECAHIAATSAPLLEPSLVVDPASGRQMPHPIRTSDGALIGPTREDPVIRAINLRIAAISQTDVAQGEALTILRYRPGQQYRLHLDTLPHTRNQRVKTVLVYLNGGFAGGETQFPSIGLTVAPRGGDALVFDNVTEDGRPDVRTKHAGLPVRAGAKWLATRWIRARSFDPWRGPEVPL